LGSIGVQGSRKVPRKLAIEGFAVLRALRSIKLGLNLYFNFIHPGVGLPESARRIPIA
jgi:hypothetical protein